MWFIVFTNTSVQWFLLLSFFHFLSFPSSPFPSQYHPSSSTASPWKPWLPLSPSLSAPPRFPPCIVPVVTFRCTQEAHTALPRRQRASRAWKQTMNEHTVGLNTPDFRKHHYYRAQRYIYLVCPNHKWQSRSKNTDKCESQIPTSPSSVYVILL